MKKLLMMCVGMGWAMASAADVLIAREDFDGGQVGLIGSSVPTLDGGGGDTHAVGATAAWPTTGGTPFSITDNSVGAVGDTSAFAGDTEGIYGINSDFNNQFLGISDSDEFGTVISTWDFDISSAADSLTLRIDIGSMEGSTFSYDAGTLLTFAVSIDGGPTQTAFNVFTDPNGDGYAYRALDNGTVIVANDNALGVTGDNPVAKWLAEDGSVAGNTFLDKSPASGPGAGTLDTFVTGVNGLGSVLTLSLSSFVPFEAVAIDNIELYAIPEPGTAALLGLAGLWLIRRRRR